MVRIEEQGGRTFAPHADTSLSAFNHAAEAARQLVSAGAIMILPESPLEHHLVGHLEWLEPRRLFWFTAYGEELSDGHLLDFDTLHVVEDQGIYFALHGNIVSQLMPIERAGVEDPDDYRIAWQLWQEVSPLRQRLIERSCTALTRGGAMDNLIDGFAVDGNPGPRSAPWIPSLNALRLRV